MKIVRFIGGLGNQMFQFAFCQSLLRFDDVKMDLTLYKKEKFHFGYEIQKIFHQNLDVATPSQIKNLGFYENNKLAKLKKRFYHPKKTHYIEKVLGYDEKIPTNGDVYFEGYWQNYKYFIDIKDEIQSIFSFPSIEDNLNSKCLEKIRETRSVSIHIRRKDFLRKRNSHLVNLSENDYYKRSIQKVQDELGDELTYFIFSDDMEWVKKEFGLKNSVFVDWNQGENSFRDMQLMSYCKANIIANSSFSWWGAYLNAEKLKKVVISPQTWYKDDEVDGRKVVHNAINLPEWITIK
ncbi:alpha-1,2-fucosyltransferase [Bacillus sp. SJS]|uniref:alpha-1,2-fucosyltransferase n=1 Tax=Bacillus sp. SJS TaxID=1423321 RepID=UPI00068B3631|nr:alpha-1,2-fucosyltransferase [Bacillus sp. SJS]KZZ83901.1 hypothetical protein AS29_014220 [Bacillus sp. SJS]